MAVAGGAFYSAAAGGLHSDHSPTDIYSLQLQSWYEGHTHLDIAPNPALSRLPNPYDGLANAKYRILDISYYRNRYFSYYGVAPIVVVQLPWHFLTGRYLRQAGTILCLVFAGLLASLFILYRAWRRYFPDASFLFLAVSSLLVTFGNPALWLILEPQFYEVAQAGAVAFQLIALAACLQALTSRRWRPWLLAASLATGLAIASRPSFLFSGLLLLPVVLAVWRRGIATESEKPSPARLADVLLTACLPAALIGLALLYYNYTRFDSPFEFGDRYALTADDQRTMVMTSLSFLPRNLGIYLWAPAPHEHYFPFLDRQVNAVGMRYFPFFILALGGGLLLNRRLRKSRPLLTSFASAVALAVTGTFAVLAVFVMFWMRYQVDFSVVGLISAVLGWWILDAFLADQKGLRRTNAIAGTVLAAITLAHFLLFSAAFAGHRADAIGDPVNRLISRLEAIGGAPFGPRVLSVTLPTHPSTEPQRLLTAKGADFVYLQSQPDGMIRIGYFHAGAGGPLSAAFSPGAGPTHRVEVTLGSLLPPAASEYFSGWSETAIDHARHQLRVIWDGRTVLEQSADFLPVGPGEIRIGPGVTAATAPLPRGALQRADQSWSGYARLTLRLPASPPDHPEPLLATGRTGAGQVLWLHYLGDGRVRFAVDGWPSGLAEGAPVTVDFTQDHTVDLEFGGLAAGPGTPKRTAIYLDGREVLAGSVNFAPAEPATITWGTNAIHSSVAGGMFTGTILSVTPLSRADFAAAHPSAQAQQSGPVTLEFTLERVPGRTGQPLVVTGKTGAGDLVYLVEENSQQVRFSFDHWGVGGLNGEPVAFDYRVPHRLTVALGSLYDPTTAGAAERTTVRVTLDGREVLAGHSPCYPSVAAEIEIGRNEIGGSACGANFAGQIHQIVP